MKELSIEEKAKAYDNVRDKIAIRFGSNVVKEIFSEYEESEDGIRKALISFLKSPFVNENITDKKVAPWIAWLEKQGNINPTEDELEALRMAAYEPTKNWSEKLQSLYMKLSHCEQGEQKL